MEKQFRHPLERPSMLIQFSEGERVQRIHSLLGALLKELEASDWLQVPNETMALEVPEIPELFRALGQALHRRELLDY